MKIMVVGNTMVSARNYFYEHIYNPSMMSVREGRYNLVATTVNNDMVSVTPATEGLRGYKVDRLYIDRRINNDFIRDVLYHLVLFYPGADFYQQIVYW